MAAVASPAVSRNDPCPCGSGRRFKECHGALGSAPSPSATTAAARRSRYRPAGRDWATLGEDDCDRLGAWMERALKEQREQRPREAERLYRAVLEEAPQTHDALHMLGVIRLGLGDFTDAEQLIKRAMRLRPEYPAIATNWSIVRRAIDARDRSGVEILAEHALPLLFEALGTKSAVTSGSSATDRQALHVVGPGMDHQGDAAWWMARLAQLLAPLQPECWNAPRAQTRWQAFDPRSIDVSSGRRPRSGYVVLLGVESDTDWLREPIDHVLLFVDRSPPSVALDRLRRIAADGARSVTLVFDSHAKARRFGLDRHVLLPPIGVGERIVREPNAGVRSSGCLRVATVGQDGRRVVLPAGEQALLAVAQAAGELRVLDPGPLRYALGLSKFVVCVPRDASGFAPLLCQSDVYLHRDAPWWSEDSRPLFEAMLRGVPVLCSRKSIYAEYIADGVDGWLYEDAGELQPLASALRADRARVRAASEAARAKALALFEPRTLSSAYQDLISGWMHAR